MGTVVSRTRIPEGRAAERSPSLREPKPAKGSQVLHIVSHCDPPDVKTTQEHYRKALSLADELGMRPLLARSHPGLGKLYQRTGDRPKAQEHLTTAIQMLREMDMRFWLEQAEVELKELGSKSTKKARRRP